MIPKKISTFAGEIKITSKMNLLNFTTTFPDEQSCKLKWKEMRDKAGIVCPHCGSTTHYWKSDKECYECKKCKYRQSLRCNTIMHLSKLPFRYWFVAFHLLTSTKKSFSAKELQRQLGHKNYDAIWALLHKLRMAMGTRDAQYTLSGVLELDEDRKARRREATATETGSRQPKEKQSVGNGRKAQHRPQVIRKEDIGKILPWVHIAISNAKRMILNTFHDVKPEYLQSYLNEFCYTFNRRYFGERQFDRLLVAGVAYKNEFRYHIR
ncbi:hypothetical protein AGMMS49965_08860 [Bacteroidia bacterium]|nr:hypothetical protein AGMMS49965_08860 [Bacteroidia bacterium]